MSPILSQRSPVPRSLFSIFITLPMQSLWLIVCILLNTHTYIVTIVLGGLCDNIGFVGVSAKCSYVTASPSHHDKAIPILSTLLFMHVGHPYIPLFKIRRIFNLLVSPPFLALFRQVATRVYNYYPKPALLPLLHPCPHCSSTMRFVTKKRMRPVLSVCILLLLHIELHYCDDCITSPRFVALHHLVSEIAKCTA